ncbi:YciI family protein [Sphingomonas sp. LT1P40]|uniref:YciI family protein n=1 Tax=Alteristakelama amylovorans TaxID=3096166 RepID=UPI002FC99798
MAARLDAAPVCVILLEYLASEEDVDAQLKPHVEWLTKGFDEGLFLIAGRQVPRTSGVILCRGKRAEVEALAATDPFVTSGVAKANVVEMAVSFAADDWAPLLG